MKSSEEIKSMLISRLNSTLKRPRMWITCNSDLEMQLRSLLCDISYIDDIELTARDIINKLILEELYYPTNVINGVTNIFKNLVPDIVNYSEYICSVYAREVYKAGYLEVDNILTVDEFENLKQRIIGGEFSKGYDLDKLTKKLPTPSFVIKNTILCYLSENSNEQWIYFDLPSFYTEEKGYETILLSIRFPAKTFESGFELTKEGYEHTKRGISRPKCDMDTIMKQWNEGRKFIPNESMPTIKENPKESLWKHLW